MRNERLDPRVVFLFVMVSSTACVAVREALPMVPVLLSAVVAAAWMRAPVAQVLRRFRGLWVMLVSVAAFQALFSGNIVTGLLIGAAVVGRLAVLMLGGAMLARYPGHALVQVMLQLRLPYQLAYMVSIGLRFVPRFSESYRDSLTAMQLRGVELKRLKWKDRLKVYTYLLMPTVASGLDSARKLAMAMELRGFGAQPKRSSYAPLRMRGRDWLALAAVIVWAVSLVAGMVVWRWCM